MSEQQAPVQQPDLNDKSYQREARDEFVPYVERDGQSETEEFVILAVTQRYDGRNSNNCVHIRMLCQATTRPNVVHVGQEYKYLIDLQQKGQFNAPGTPAHRAATDHANMVAAIMGTTTKQAAVDGLNLNEAFENLKKAGESLIEKGHMIKIRSVGKYGWEDKDKTKPKIDPKTGKQIVYTNRYVDALKAK